MISNKLKRILYFYILPYIGLVFVKLLSLTFRIKVIGQEIEENINKSGNSLIYASLHQRFILGATFFMKRKPIVVMVSHSLDGELINRIIHMLGWSTVRGSSSRGGDKAMKELIIMARRGFRIVHGIDGPTGPYGVVKPGLIRMAQITGVPIVPIIFSPERKWIFNSWDRCMLPKPFTRLIVRFGNAITIPRDVDEAEFEEKRIFMESVMKELYNVTDSFWKQPIEIRRIF